MEKSGESGFAAGSWQRVWMRFTMTRNAKPGYLAVWLQGPGDIWIDDLSLREVISPLFSLSARQFLVDGSDRGIPLRFSRTSGTNPMTVFVTLPGAKTAQAVAIDQEGEVEIPFDARTMPIGHYEVRAESTQGDGTACTATTTIERVRGPFDP
jgi:hypothetical protein